MAIKREHPRFATRAPVDFVVVGSGAAGGVMDKELSEAGFDVVVLEQGPYLRKEDFRHDEVAHFFKKEWMAGWKGGHPQTFRQTEEEEV